MTQQELDAVRTVSRGRMVPTLVKERDGWHARWRSLDDTDSKHVDAFCRRAAMSPLSINAESQKYETLHDAWMLALRSRTGLVKWEASECEEFARTLEAWSGRVFGDVSARSETVFSFHDNTGEFIVEAEPPHSYARYVALGEAARMCPVLAHLRLDGKGKLTVQLKAAEAEKFLKEDSKTLRENGFCVEGAASRADISADADIGEVDEATGRTKIKLRVRVAGEVVSLREILFLLDQGKSLVFFRNRWIEVDRDILKQAARALEKAEGKTLSAIEAVSFVQGMGHVDCLAIEEAKAHGWLRGLVNALRANGELTGESFTREMESLSGRAALFKGTLRDYQVRGAAWMRFLTDHGFGALLADDMGLGKTIEAIAWMCVNPGPKLIVLPVSLISNWRHELKTFAPNLKVYVHHGDARHSASGFVKAAQECDVTLTSYTLLVKDYGDFASVAWKGVILDEAQTIKNPRTRFARAVKALGAQCRIALTGTPIENSVADLWSLEEFLNPGFFPPKKDFDELYTKPISESAESKPAKKLRRAIEPFLLRRLKTDPGIADELGEKREVREYCELDPVQIKEYELALATWHASDRSRGEAFTLLTRLKLVCDGFPSGRSGGGKMVRLLDLAESIFLSGESMLIFTQYVKVARVIKSALEKKFGRYVPILHGGLSQKEREREIAAFNNPGPRAFVLSLKAGGLGLNLVKATHVVHFDRWWNPAVEAQATDRAYRIGQTSNVLVHLFISPGTLEERVDSMLEKKLATADKLVTSGESFLYSLSREEFDETVKLEGGGA